MLRQAARANLYDAWLALSLRPTAPENRRRQHRLKGDFASVSVHGVWRDQWQYEVTAAGRIWYVVDDEKRLVWVTLASASHPKGTE
jgi:hypothetical protein